MIIFRLAFWILAIILVASLLMSLGYTFAHACTIAALFPPGALALEYLFPQAKKASERIYLILALLTAQVLAILFSELLLEKLFYNEGNYCFGRYVRELPSIIVNPVFPGIIIALMGIGDALLARKLKHWYADMPLSFISERRTVTLLPGEIAYIESNDTSVRVFTTDGRSFRNKTGISNWESVLGDGFLRIHRSYLVNRKTICSSDSASVTLRLGEAMVNLPVSRKYRDSVNCA